MLILEEYFDHPLPHLLHVDIWSGDGNSDHLPAGWVDRAGTKVEETRSGEKANAHILEGTRVSKNFGGLAAVSNVDFHVNQGEILGLIGPNGAGKTTLFNLISGALAFRSGEIKFKEKRISRMKPYQICRARRGQDFPVGQNIWRYDGV